MVMVLNIYYQFYFLLFLLSVVLVYTVRQGDEKPYEDARNKKHTFPLSHGTKISHMSGIEKILRRKIDKQSNEHGKRKNSLRGACFFYLGFSRLVAQREKESFSLLFSAKNRVRGVTMRIMFVILGLQVQRDRASCRASVCTRSYYLLSVSRFTSHIYINIQYIYIFIVTETHLQTNRHPTPR